MIRDLIHGVTAQTKWKVLVAVLIIREKEEVRMKYGLLTPFRNRDKGVTQFQDPFDLIRREINSVFDNAFRGIGSSFPTMGDIKVDVYEEDKEFIISAEVPGVSEDDLNISVNQGFLSIQGEKRQENKEEKDNFYMMERSYGSFTRTLQLPFDVNPDQVQAEMKNGILTIKIEKPKEIRETTKTIPIKKKD
ncbi:MAG TPA: Hsp20/alpha crystallin family protein [Candidatus Nitrosotenuis sp.]|nr:Hsp20/alpha crystallin family protein [Candidatus Nitrosotenuis sp.]